MADLETLPARMAAQTDEAEVSGRYIGTEVRTFPVDISVPEAYHDSRPAERPRRGRFASRPNETLVPQDTQAYTPLREVYIGDELITADRDIKIEAGDAGYPIATITLWNLSTGTWNNVGRDSEVRVRLGWEQAAETVFVGEVLIKRTRLRGGDRAHIIRARGHSADQLHGRYARSYGKVAPHTIVDDIATNMDAVAEGYIATDSERMDHTYVLTSARELRDWLDDLATIASRQTGRRWIWYVDKDKLNFHPRTAQTSDVVTLGGQKSVTRATPSGMTTPGREFPSEEIITRCEPITRRSLTCHVEETDAIDGDQLYRVAKYVHDSTTTSGRHHTTMLLEPLDTTVDERWMT